MAKQYDAPPAMAIDPAKRYTATITTDRGDIVAELYADKVPVTVNNFVVLARDGYYDGVTFHRVIGNFMAQTGDPTGTGRGGPGYKFADEFDPSLATTAPACSPWPTPAPTPTARSSSSPTGDAALDGKHAVFGQVTEGMDVVFPIPDRDPMSAREPGVAMTKVTITESDA